MTTLITLRTASADSPADLAKRGLDQYKAGNYPEAVQTLSKAYEADPRPELLYALAQAERLAGDCKAALPHYRKVTEAMADLNAAKFVQQNLSLCEAKLEPARTPAPAPAPASEPKIITKTVVREVPRTDRLAATLAIGGALAIGTSCGLFVAAASDRDAADRAGSIPHHDTLADRSKLEQTVGFVTLGAGVAMAGFAVYRWLRPSHTRSTEMAIVPIESGSIMAVSSVW